MWLTLTSSLALRGATLRPHAGKENPKNTCRVRCLPIPVGSVKLHRDSIAAGTLCTPHASYTERGCADCWLQVKRPASHQTCSRTGNTRQTVEQAGSGTTRNQLDTPPPACRSEELNSFQDWVVMPAQDGCMGSAHVQALARLTRRLRLDCHHLIFAGAGRLGKAQKSGNPALAGI